MLTSIQKICQLLVAARAVYGSNVENSHINLFWHMVLTMQSIFLKDSDHVVLAIENYSGSFGSKNN